MTEAFALAHAGLLVPAHGIGSRRDLPLPFEFVVGGAVVVLVATFLLLSRAWQDPRYGELRGRALPRLSAVLLNPIVEAIARVAVVLGVGWFALALAAGQDRLTNPAFGVVYVLVWVGLVPLSLLFGPVWRGLHPVRTLVGLVRRNEDRALLQRVGVWPAALGIVAYAWLELVHPDRTTLPVLQGFVIAWVVVVVGGAVVVGRGWVGSADPFEAYADAVARLSWLQTGLRDGRRTILAVNPLRNLLSWSPPAGSGAVACALLGSTAYDSFSSTTVWIRAVQASPIPRWVWGTAGLFALIAVVRVTYLLACRAMQPALKRRTGLLRTGDDMVVGLVPIVVGYALGHYLTLLVLEGQRTIIQLSDPLGRGWNVFGTAERGVAATVVTYPTVTALLQLVFVVGGHVLGIVAAHDRAVGLLVRQKASRAQIPMLLVMVFFTVSGLVLLFSP